MRKIIVAVDGPAGAGKSTLSRAAARKLGLTYIDTGAMYRACALMALETGVDVRRETPQLHRMFDEFDLVLITEGDVQNENRVILNDVDITREIREPQISIGASYISAIPYVRDKMVELQRNMAEEKSVLMDGRDIGTNVFPNADVKIFLTADIEKRAERRYKELLERGEEVTFSTVFEDMKKRDENDSARAYAPLKKAAEAIVVDTSELTLSEATEKLISVITEAVK